MSQRHPVGISEQFHKEMMETRRKLLPIMKRARDEKKDFYMTVNKLFINSAEYKTDNYDLRENVLKFVSRNIEGITAVKSYSLKLSQQMSNCKKVNIRQNKMFSCS